MTTAYLARAKYLMNNYGILAPPPGGVFRDEPLMTLEYVLHEVAHYLTLGFDVDDLPEDLSTCTEKILNRIPDHSADALELDTTAVTYFAGCGLGLWRWHWSEPKDDALEAFAKTCKDSMRNTWSVTDILDGLEERIQNKMVQHMGERLACWFDPKISLIAHFAETVRCIRR